MQAFIPPKKYWIEVTGSLFSIVATQIQLKTIVVDKSASKAK